MGGLVTLFTLGGFMFVMFRRDIHTGNGTAEADTGRGTGRTGTKVNG
jgi:hypothetical protein